MVSVLACSVVDRGFEHQSAVLRDKGKEWLVLENASEWIDMSTPGLLFH
jgi:hypothetical protein